MLTLETDRLTLRMLGQSDFEAYAEMCADPEVMRYIGDGQPLTRALAWRSLAAMVGHWSLRGYGLWAVEERATGHFVGRVGFWNPEGWPGFEIGWMLSRAYWGQGYATEAARAALQFAFTELNQPHVISLIQPENAASIRVAQRLVERQVDSTDVLGKPTLVYRITRDEWQAQGSGVIVRSRVLSEMKKAAYLAEELDFSSAADEARKVRHAEDYRTAGRDARDDGCFSPTASRATQSVG